MNFGYFGVQRRSPGANRLFQSIVAYTCTTRLRPPCFAE
jgi:hypothetical protein